MELIVGFLLAVLGIIGAAVSRQLSDEFKAWTPWITKHLVRRAVRRLPEDQRNRFKEEWLSHLDDIPGEVGKVIAALGFMQASHSMALAVTPIRRVADVAVAWSLLLFASPVFILIAVLTKLEGHGPIFVTLQYENSSGKVVSMLKFRTSQTRLGAALRILHGDYLPQLVNVLRGEASLPLKDFVEAIRENPGPWLSEVWVALLRYLRSGGRR